MPVNTQSITQLITEFRALHAKDAITPEALGYLLQRIANLFGQTVDENSLLKKGSYVRDLGMFASVDAALQAAAAREIVDDRDLRILHWRTDGDGGTILMSRWGGHYATQLLFLHGQSRETKVRLITGGGNYEVGEWQNIVMPVSVTYNAATRQLRFASLKGTTAVTLPAATKSADGLMTANDKQKVDWAIEGTSVRFDDMVEDANVLAQSTTQAGGEVVYIRSKKVFAYRVGVQHYKNWSVKGVTSADLYMNEARTEPLSNKVYLLGVELYMRGRGTADLVPVQHDMASLNRLQGRAMESDASTDPFLFLGDFRPHAGQTGGNFWKGVNAVIDSTFSREAGADNAKYCGEMRMNVMGSTITLHQIAINHTVGDYLQIISGNIMTTEAGTITYGDGVYARYFRPINGGVAGAWTICSLTPNDKALIDSYGATVRDLGTFSSADAALEAAAAREIVEDHSLRVLHWHTDGDGGTILMSRWGGYYVTQYLFMYGQPRECKARMITCGGNYQVYDWKKLLIPSDISYNNADRSIVLKDIRGQQLHKITLPEATTSRAGMMSKEMVATLNTTSDQLTTLKKKVEDLEKLIEQLQATPSATLNPQ